MLEDIVKQIRALLQNQLPAKLDQIELERADGVTLKDVQSFHLQPWDKGGRLSYPNITILGEATNATNALSRSRELRHRISVWVTIREVSPDSELGQTKLWRYVEAVERILASDPTLGGKVMDSIITSHEYPLKKGEEFIRSAILIMTVLERPSTGGY